MKKNKIINEEEYNNIINRLEEIKKEEETLKELYTTKEYTAHIELPDNFWELLIALKRENAIIDEQLLLYSKKIKTSITQKIDYRDLMILIMNNEIPPELSSKKEFIDIFPKITDLTTKRNANEFLYNFISQMINEKDLLLAKKNNYEKLKNKTRKISKQNT